MNLGNLAAHPPVPAPASRDGDLPQVFAPPPTPLSEQRLINKNPLDFKSFLIDFPQIPAAH